MASSSMDESFVVQHFFHFLSSATSVAEKVSFSDNAWLIPNVETWEKILLHLWKLCQQ